MSNQWQNSMFGCFGDFRTCILTFFVPGYTVGKNAEVLGEDCFVTGLLYCIGIGVAQGPILRWRIREMKGIEGSMLKDALWHTCCPCCAVIQEAREIQDGDMLSKAREDIRRE